LRGTVLAPLERVQWPRENLFRRNTMKRITWIRLGTLAVLTACLLLLVRPARAQSDAWITSKVKVALLTTRDMPGLPIDVDTYDGVVTLSGKVKTEAERQHAEQVASRIDGVRDVRDLVQVVPDAMSGDTRIADRRLEDRVKDALDNDPEIDRRDVRVKSVNAGEVVLAGHMHSVSDEARALEVVRRVPGTRAVASEITVDDRSNDRGDMNRSNRYDRTASNEQGDGGNRMGDAWITTRVKLRFATDRDVPAGSINVDTWHGRVTLFGRVPSSRVRSLATREARSIRGVRMVDNQLVVVPRWEGRPVAQRDDRILTNVHDRLADADLRGAHIRVHVVDGVVQLTGSVRDTHDRLTAVTVARNTNGVVSVRDDLRERSASSASRY
jgi:osmotically-inducible protein OsmY